MTNFTKNCRFGYTPEVSPTCILLCLSPNPTKNSQNRTPVFKDIVSLTSKCHVFYKTPTNNLKTDESHLFLFLDPQLTTSHWASQNKRCRIMMITDHIPTFDMASTSTASFRATNSSKMEIPIKRWFSVSQSLTWLSLHTILILSSAVGTRSLF